MGLTELRELLVRYAQRGTSFTATEVAAKAKVPVHDAFSAIARLDNKEVKIVDGTTRYRLAPDTEIPDLQPISGSRPTVITASTFPGDLTLSASADGAPLIKVNCGSVRCHRADRG